MPDIIKDNGTWVLQPDKDLADLEMNLVDLTDGSWTSIDITSQLKSLAFEDSANKATMNAIAAGTNVQFSNNSYNSVRWFKLLTDSKGTQVNTSDQFIFIATIQAMSSSNPAPFGFAIGNSINPYGTGSVGQTRQCFHHLALCNERQGATEGRKHEYDAILKLAAGGVVANMLTSSVCQMVQTWGNKNGAGALSFSNVNSRSSSNLSSMTGSVPLYVQVAMGSRQNTDQVLEDAEHKQILKYLVIRLDNT
jgi:hypothetical protein